MKYLKKFETVDDVAMSIKPNVVLVADTGNVYYNVMKGVFIQHIDGTLYTTDEWTAGDFTSDLANGVAVCDVAGSFVIAKADAYDGVVKWGSDTSSAISGVMLTKDKATAKTDYAGAENTELIAATSGAAYECANYTFPNGTTGYLPALGEWVIAYANESAIDVAMELIEGTSISSTYYWSSTQWDAREAWRFDWWDGSPSGNFKSASFRARAFCSL